MAFGCIDTYGLPSIRNYKQALRHYESITPIRGSDNLRPIGSRRKQHMQIVKLFNGDIACQLYSTNCIVYHQDDSFTVNFGGWNTQSTAAFISGISPFYASSTGYIRIGNDYYKVPEDGLKILPDGTPANPVQEYRTLLDKKKAAETRKKLKPFMNWVNALMVLGAEPEHVAYGENRSAVRAVIERNCLDSYPTVAGTYFKYDFQGGKESLFQTAYRITESFIEVPVPLGVMKTGTDWG